MQNFWNSLHKIYRKINFEQHFPNYAEENLWKTRQLCIVLSKQLDKRELIWQFEDHDIINKLKLIVKVYRFALNIRA